jgi:hypothetical protein
MILRPVPEPASQDRRIQLLDLMGTSQQHTAITISAYEYKNKNYTDAKTLLRRELDQEVFNGVEQVHGPSKTTVGDKTFFYFETRRGTEQHEALAAEMSGYVLHVDIRSNNADVLHKIVMAFSQAEFFPPPEAQHRAGAEAAIYQGPAISEQHMRAIREEKPVDHIAAGAIKGTTYSNSQIGVTYELPQGWTLQPEGAIEPAVERYREKVTGDSLLGPRERAVVKACRKTLLSVWRTRPGSNGEVPYDEFGEVTLSVMPLACFPNIRFPEDIKSPTAIREFVAGLQFTQPLQRDMTDARAYELGGRLFVITRGVIAYKEPGDALSRRISVALTMTEQRGFLLIWLFAAPHESDLRELMTAKIELGPDTKPVAADAALRVQGEPSTATKLDSGAPAAAAEPAAYRPSLRSGVSDETSPTTANHPHSSEQPPDPNPTGQGDTQKPQC